MHSVQPPGTTATLREHVRIVYLYPAVRTLDNIMLHKNYACRSEESSSWKSTCPLKSKLNVDRIAKNNVVYIFDLSECYWLRVLMLIEEYLGGIYKNKHNVLVDWFNVL